MLSFVAVSIVEFRRARLLREARLSGITVKDGTHLPDAGAALSHAEHTIPRRREAAGCHCGTTGYLFHVASVSHVIAATLRKCPENNENKRQHGAT